MIQRYTDEWRASQQRANALEKEYAQAMVAYCRGEGPPPPRESKERLLAARARAGELLSRALREIDRRMLERGPRPGEP